LAKQFCEDSPDSPTFANSFVRTHQTRKRQVQILARLRVLAKRFFASTCTSLHK
jgi:hypothetical protein